MLSAQMCCVGVQLLHPLIKTLPFMFVWDGSRSANVADAKLFLT